MPTRPLRRARKSWARGGVVLSCVIHTRSARSELRAHTMPFDESDEEEDMDGGALGEGASKKRARQGGLR